MKPQVIQAQDGRAQLEAARRTAEALAGGQVVVLPTETVYGVAACVTQAEAMARLRRMKGRPQGAKPFSVHIGASRQVTAYVNQVPAVAERLIRKAWPGPLGLVLPVENAAQTAVAELVGPDGLRELFHENSIGIRCPDDPVTTRALAEMRDPVVAASANKPGNPPPTLAHQAIEELGQAVDLVVDTGATRYTKPSTLVRITPAGGWEILRVGVLDERAIRRLLTSTILFLCSGNTCRSPMAEALCKSMLAAKLGTKADRLADAGYEVVSAGVGASSGSAASPHAVEACRRIGADLSAHRSRPLTPDMIRQADRIFTMCQHHTEAVVRMVPEAKNRVERLCPSEDIYDPAGSQVQEYVQCMQRIRTALEARSGDIV